MAVAVQFSPLAPHHLFGLGFSSHISLLDTSDSNMAADLTPDTPTMSDTEDQEHAAAIASRGRMDSVYSTPPIGVTTSPEIPVGLLFVALCHAHADCIGGKANNR